MKAEGKRLEAKDYSGAFGILNLKLETCNFRLFPRGQI
jgi:hypothetical protein